MALVTVRTAAQRLGVSYSTFKQWIYKGSVRTVRTNGGHHRIADAEIDRLMAAQGRLPATPRPARGGGQTSMRCHEPLDLRVRNPMMAAACSHGPDGALVNPLLERRVTDAETLRGRPNRYQRHGQ